jgi:solute carrier family 35 protein E3
MGLLARPGRKGSLEGEMSSDGGTSQMGVLGALGLSVTSSVAIVICNKYLMGKLAFIFGQYCFQGFRLSALLLAVYSLQQFVFAKCIEKCI